MGDRDVAGMAVTDARLTRWTLALAVFTVGCGAPPRDATRVDTAELPLALVAHWASDEGSGKVVGDRSGNGHDGQLTGGSWVAEGRFGGALALRFGDAVAVPDFPDATPSWSASLWAKATQEQIDADTGD